LGGGGEENRGRRKGRSFVSFADKKSSSSLSSPIPLLRAEHFELSFPLFLPTSYLSLLPLPPGSLPVLALHHLLPTRRSQSTTQTLRRTACRSPSSNLFPTSPFLHLFLISTLPSTSATTVPCPLSSPQRSPPLNAAPVRPPFALLFPVFEKFERWGNNAERN
jgi:hypothetical protein